MTAALDRSEMPSSAPRKLTPPTHVVTIRVLLLVIVSLLVLTWITVSATKFDLGGAGNVAVAIGIATIKATLVALYFMHLRYEGPFFGLILACALLMVALFIILVLMDTQEYRPDLIIPLEQSPPAPNG